MKTHVFQAAVIGGLDRHGFLTTPQLTAWTCVNASDQAVTKRLKRMKAHDLLQEHLLQSKNLEPVPCWTLTNAGQALTSGSHRPVLEPKTQTARHHLVVAQVAIELHLAGHHVATERELWFEHRQHRDTHGFEVRVRGDSARRIHLLPDGRRLRYSEPGVVEEWIKAWSPEFVPDLRVHSANQPTDGWGVPLTPGSAWEIELTTKSRSRIEAKLRWYNTQAGYTEVVYACGDAAVARAVKRAADQAARGLNLRIEVLSEVLLDAAVSRRNTRAMAAPCAPSYR